MPQTTTPHTLTPPVQANAGMPSMNSTEILGGRKAVEINHNGLTYKLQATRLGKLILTK